MPPKNFSVRKPNTYETSTKKIEKNDFFYKTIKETSDNMST